MVLDMCYNSLRYVPVVQHLAKHYLGIKVRIRALVNLATRHRPGTNNRQATLTIFCIDQSKRSQYVAVSSNQEIPFC